MIQQRFDNLIHWIIREISRSINLLRIHQLIFNYFNSKIIEVRFWFDFSPSQISFKFILYISSVSQTLYD